MKKHSDLKIWAFGPEPTYNYTPIDDESKADFEKINHLMNLAALELTEMFRKNPEDFNKLFVGLENLQSRLFLNENFEIVTVRNALFSDDIYLTISTTESVEVSFSFPTWDTIPNLTTFCAEGHPSDIVDLLTLLRKNINLL